VSGTKGLQCRHKAPNIVCFLTNKRKNGERAEGGGGDEKRRGLLGRHIKGGDKKLGEHSDLVMERAAREARRRKDGDRERNKSRTRGKQKAAI